MFRIPTITKNLLIINLIAFLATTVLQLRGIDLSNIGGLHFFMANDFHLYQLVTYLFLHANFMHILSNMFGLWMFGCVIENVWGPKKFLFYYITCGIGAGLLQEIAQLGQFYMMISAQDPSVTFGEIFAIGQQLSGQLNAWTTIGASGAVYAVILAFGMTFPNERLFIIPFPFPIKAKWFVLGYVAIEFFSALGTSGDGVAHTAHLGGMLFGFLMIRYWNRHPNSGYDRGRGMQFFDNLKRNFEQRKQHQGNYSNPNMHVNRGGGSKEDDMEYNARKRQNQEEIDAILDKIRKSGYDSLTKEEKKKLFDASNQS
ncbi:MAG: rhomboid family intramembrane serine protease [Prevotella ruminicola]|uniref:Rhomboid family intramembrane serine protease n=1 Tax=Xylanibacter ruminicola TaxID=839 RepID=A0A9D5SA82_XYLRU|nr:rhomboid family intramembrane serine protease [Xylanibacter ruminicola]